MFRTGLTFVKWWTFGGLVSCAGTVTSITAGLWVQALARHDWPTVCAALIVGQLGSLMFGLPAYLIWRTK